MICYSVLSGSFVLAVVFYSLKTTFESQVSGLASTTKGLWCRYGVKGWKKMLLSKLVIYKDKNLLGFEECSMDLLVSKNLGKCFKVEVL